MEAYENGFRCGLNWKDIWEDRAPGGPWVPNREYSNDPKWIAIWEQAVIDRTDWLAGWESGHDEKILRAKAA